MMSIIVHSAEQVKPARALLVIWRHICPKAASSAPPPLPSLCACAPPRRQEHCRAGRLLMEMFVRAYKFFANSFFTTMPRGAKNLGINIVQRCFNPSGWRMRRIHNWFFFLYLRQMVLVSSSSSWELTTAMQPLQSQHHFSMGTLPTTMQYTVLSATLDQISKQEPKKIGCKLLTRQQSIQSHKYHGRWT